MKSTLLYLCLAAAMLFPIGCSSASKPGAPIANAAELSQSKYGKYVVTELKMPEEKQKINAEYSKYASRILWMDEDVVEGAFHVNASWYLKAATTLADKPHVHDADEIIGFFSSDPDKPYDLGGEVEIWLEDEKQVITKSAMIFIPAGMSHCPLILKRVDRPIFHFSIVPSGLYVREDNEGESSLP